MSNVFIFLGATLPVVEAQALLDAHYLPPAAMGDVYNVVECKRPDVIGIIDGYFDSVPSVWHKEILFALSQGIRVVGASSMGALRAAELSTFGMEGVGWVFESFLSGTLEDDDEVAIVHGDDTTGYQSLSTAMVNLRVGLLRACDQGIISTKTRDAMVAMAKRYFYPERSWERLLREAVAHDFPTDEIGGLRRFVETKRPDVKREDACKMLKQLTVAPAEGASASRVEFTTTIFWNKLTRNEQRVGSSLTAVVRRENLRRFTKATDHDLAGLLRDSLLIHLVKEECERLGVELAQEQFDTAVRDFRLRQNLTSADSMRSWLERAGLTTNQFSAIMELETRIITLLVIYANEVDEHFLDALSLSGRIGEMLTRQSIGEQQIYTNVSTQQQEASASELETFYRSRIRQFAGSLHHHARDLGFASESELIDEVRKIYKPTDE